ncbi:hypothetical protein DPMN_056872 [Dreissena polymorpha]|uniref:Uncharacterized protein n=2 Tax=Dreissena polymorpha TaxID=45954 RepID=A0A9D4HVH6_DREPO|nr:hypothetical protein DPMN_063403 [Dreissena polymorpha]KAH3730873.1 hypothetical protein DPMN_056872 [Dreissena polymorpha]
MSANGKSDQAQLNFKGQKPQTKPATKKQRADSNNSNNNSMEELSSIHTQLEVMTEGICHLRDDLKSMLKKGEIEELIMNTVTTIMGKIEETMIKRIETETKNITKEFKEQIAGLEFENEQLKQKMDELKSSSTKAISELQTQVDKNYDTSRDALKLANYNEQYSRKNNVKIMNIEESPQESETSLIQTISSILKTTADVELKPEDIIAIHRIPTKKGNIRPILLKLRNNNAKSSIMRKRTPMKAKGFRLVDDVTQRNQGLISRLFLHPDIKSAWFFNGSVFGQTNSEERIKFDIFDNIDNTISAFRNRNRKPMTGVSD